MDIQRYSARLAVFNLVVLFVLIGFGGTVRALEAGMGCPDWPRCYGKFWPPLNASALPDNYKHDYARTRAKKNERLASLLTYIGAHKAAAQLRAHTEPIAQDANFSPLKAWIEYLNRLVGVLLGIGILLYAFLSWRARTHNPPHQRKKALIALCIVILQGLIGALVVQTHLFPIVISLHMLLSFALLFILLKSLPRPRTKILPLPKGTKMLWRMIGLVFFVQIVLGTQIRETIEAHRYHLPRAQLVATANHLLLWHRSTALGLIALQACLTYCLLRQSPLSLSQCLKIWKYFPQSASKALLCLLFMGAASGIGALLYYQALPPIAQVLHLWMPFIIFALWTQSGTFKQTA